MKTTTTFRSCGLDKDNNLFNERFMVKCNDEEGMINFMYEIFDVVEYPYVAIFAITNDNRIIIGHKSEDEVQCGIAEPDADVENSRNYVHKVIAGCQEEMEYPCYGLLEQTDDGNYVVIMD